MPRELPQNAQPFPPAGRGPFQIAASVNGDGELELHLTMHNGGVRYPIGPYSEIREFEVMLNISSRDSLGMACTSPRRPRLSHQRGARSFISGVGPTSSSSRYPEKTGTASTNCSGTLWRGQN
jgi:hypothetical protein